MLATPAPHPLALCAVLLVCCLAFAAPAAAQTGKVVIAHRGASGYLPEHTLEAKTLAHAMGANYLEQDLVLTRDDVPIVLHDICIDTVTDVAGKFPDRKRADGRFYAIDFSLQELKQLRVTERFDPQTGRARYPNRFPIWQSTFQISTLEEELQLIQGLNKTTGRSAGIYPEVKAPAWHRREGKDLARIALAILSRYNYRTKADAVYVQCFDFEEVKRIRRELGYQGRLVQLLAEPGSPESATDYGHLLTRKGLEEVAAVADGIGPTMNQVVSWKKGGKPEVTDLVKIAHSLRLEVHPYTLRADALPAYAASFEELLRLFFVEADVDGLFTDHPDRGVAFVKSPARSR